MQKIITNNAEQTEAVGYLIGKGLSGGDLILLEGDLGGGKTTFTKGLAKALGILETVNSPTFTIVKIYQGELTLNHIDAYRLADQSDDIGISELINDCFAVSVVEWADFIASLLPAEYLRIKFNYIDEHTRELCIEPHGNKYSERLGFAHGNIVFR